MQRLSSGWFGSTYFSHLAYCWHHGTVVAAWHVHTTHQRRASNMISSVLASLGHVVLACDLYRRSLTWCPGGLTRAVPRQAAVASIAVASAALSFAFPGHCLIIVTPVTTSSLVRRLFRLLGQHGACAAREFTAPDLWLITEHLARCSVAITCGPSALPLIFQSLFPPQHGNRCKGGRHTIFSHDGGMPRLESGDMLGPWLDRWIMVGSCHDRCVRSPRVANMLMTIGLSAQRVRLALCRTYFSVGARQGASQHLLYSVHRRQDANHKRVGTNHTIQDCRHSAVPTLCCNGRFRS